MVCGACTRQVKMRENRVLYGRMCRRNARRRARLEMLLECSNIHVTVTPRQARLMLCAISLTRATVRVLSLRVAAVRAVVYRRRVARAERSHQTSHRCRQEKRARRRSRVAAHRACITTNTPDRIDYAPRCACATRQRELVAHHSDDGDRRSGDAIARQLGAHTACAQGVVWHAGTRHSTC
jgi:hypothetical protein